MNAKKSSLLDLSASPNDAIMTKKRPTVTDVAKMADVGASTVSRFLRGASVSKKASARIADAVARLGYHPDETARALRIGRTSTIGVIIPQVANMFYSRAVQLIEEEAGKRGCAVILLTHQEDLEQQRVQLSTIRRYRADGVILAPAAGSSYQDIRHSLPGTPLVAIDRFISPEMDSVVLRNHEAALTATEHLRRHGYKSIAAVVSRPEIASFAQRIEGYTEAMKAHSLKPWVLQAPDHDQLRSVLGSALLSHKKPDALLSFSNRVTQSILMTYEELGIQHSGHLPLIGFDDFELATLVDPPISVVRQPTENMVRHAINLLFRRIDGEEPSDPQTIQLLGQLVFRRSCGCH